MCRVFRRVFPPQPALFGAWARAVSAATSVAEVAEVVCLRETHFVRVRFSGEIEWRVVTWDYMGPFYQEGEWDERIRGNFRSFVDLAQSGELVRDIGDLIRTVAMKYPPRGQFDEFEADLRDRFQFIGLSVSPRVDRS